MDCKDCEALISRFLDGEILLREQADLDAHLAACEPCRKRLDAWRGNDALLKQTLGALAPSTDSEAEIAARVAALGTKPPATPPWAEAREAASPFRPPIPSLEPATANPLAARLGFWTMLDDDLHRLVRSRAARLVGLAALLLLVLWIPVRASMLRVGAADERDLILVAPGDLYADSQAAVRVVLRDGESLLPAAGAPVQLLLRGSKGGREYPLGDFRTSPDGALDARVEVPDLEPGNYLLQARTVGAHVDTASQAVRVVRTHKLLISTDKPLYQPAQTIHARLMALRTHDLKPETGRDVLFEIEDPKGNKVFKKELATSAFGIAAVDFALADEINMGDYRLRATVGEIVTERIVEVKRYVLPKFKIAVNSGKTFYLPGEKLTGTIQADYFFGKPVAGGHVKLGLATFDTAFRTVAELKGDTDAAGGYAFEYELPRYFTGIDLEKGKALLKLEVSVKDTADHEEKSVRMLPIAAQAIQVEVVHESGRIVPDVLNQFFVVTSYPDGSPARTKLRVDKPSGKWTAAEVAAAKGDANGSAMEIATNELGIARVYLVPGEISASFNCSAADAQGNQGSCGYQSGRSKQIVGTNPFLLRLDRAVYHAGDTVRVQTLGLAGLYFVDLVRAGETVLTRTLDARGPNAEMSLELPADLFGAAEVHAYQITGAGQIVRDARRILISMPENLKITANLDKESYKPGESATIDFAVTDEKGAGLPAAMGLSVVDEAVFALQDSQPGLEKIYFALEQALQEPKFSIKCAPVDLKRAVLGGALDEGRQEGARVTLTALEAPAPPIDLVRTWPAKRDLIDRMRAENIQYVRGLESAAWGYLLAGAACLLAFGFPGYIIWRRHGGEWGMTFLGGSVLAGLAAVAAGPMGLGILTVGYVVFLFLWIVGEAAGNAHAPMQILGGVALVLLVLGVGITVFGQKIARQFRASTASLDSGSPTTSEASEVSYINIGFELSSGGGGGGVMVPVPRGPAANAGQSQPAPDPNTSVSGKPLPAYSGGRTDVIPAIRVRQYFPETMFWKPEIVTDIHGRARLTMPLADSITTWRMSMQGVASDGRLGSASRGLTVFQDFFIDIDFPVALTQGDEVSVPIAVYNYLKTDQSVDLVVEQADWFDLLEGAGQQTVTMAPGEVKGASFRVKVKRLGDQSLTVYAVGSKGFHDAVKRKVAIVPNGKMFEVAISRRLGANGVETVRIPENAIDDASALFVKLYPGAMAQVVDGLESLIQMPYG